MKTDHGRSAGRAHQGEARRGNIDMAPKAPQHHGEENPAARPEIFTFEE